MRDTVQMATNTRELTVVVPIFNEEASVFECLTRLMDVLNGENFVIVVVDDGSFDDSPGQAMLMPEDKVKVILQGRNTGKGAALKTAFRGIETEYFAYIDGDLDLRPDGILRGLGALRKDPELDAAIGSKLHPDSDVEYSRSRMIMSTAYRLFVKALFNLPVSDTQTGLKVFRTKTVLPILLETQSDGWAFDLEAIVRLKSSGLQIAEIPIELDYKFTSSLNFGSAVNAIYETLKAFWLIRVVSQIRDKPRGEGGKPR